MLLQGFFHFLLRTAGRKGIYRTKGRYEEVKNAYDKACKEKAYKTGKATKMRAYLEAMKQANSYLEEWSNEMWVLMVSKAIVNRDGSIKFEFMNGQEIAI